MGGGGGHAELMRGGGISFKISFVFGITSVRSFVRGTSLKIGFVLDRVYSKQDLAHLRTKDDDNFH